MESFYRNNATKNDGNIYLKANYELDRKSVV